MTIIRYYGTFNKDGSLADNTRVVWCCDDCGREFDSRHGAIKRQTGKCAQCVSYGKPVTIEQAKKKYPAIKGVLNLSPRGGVGYDSFVIATCAICKSDYETRYRHIVRFGNKWNCKSCGKFKQFGNKILLPENLPDYVLSVDKTTLGSMGRVTAHTKITKNCPDCGNTLETEWNRIVKYGNIRCKPCASTKVWADGSHSGQNEKMRLLWQDEAYRQKTLESRSDNGAFSGLHKAVKAQMKAHGLTQFKTEKYVNGFRVDELDHDGKVIIEVYGDYWHANPASYDADYVFSRDGKTITAREIWEANRDRIEKLRSAGYSVYIIWERDFESDTDTTMSDFSDWLACLNSNVTEMVKK